MQSGSAANKCDWIRPRTEAPGLKTIDYWGEGSNSGELAESGRAPLTSKQHHWLGQPQDKLGLGSRCISEK